MRNRTLVESIVISQLDYISWCSSWITSSTQSMQNMATRTITYSTRRGLVLPVLQIYTGCLSTTGYISRFFCPSTSRLHCMIWLQNQEGGRLVIAPRSKPKQYGDRPLALKHPVCGTHYPSLSSCLILWHHFCIPEV